MQFEYRYFGSSSVRSSASGSALSFAPDTRREPTYFNGTVSQRLPFREAISALHDVVISDLRFKPKDRTEYLAWAAKQEELDWQEIAAQRSANRAEMEQARKQLEQIQRRRSERWGGYYKARRRYFDYLYRRDRDAWWVLDPVITVHPDEVFFECFSEDESSYGRLGCSHEVFSTLGEFACGTTNVDYSAALYDEFQKIREYKDTQLTVDPSGFEVQTTGEAAYREVKIDLPDTWVRGFLQVSSAATLPGVTLQLHPMDVSNLLFVLRRNKERHGPRSLRFHLDPGQPIRITVEPWNLEIRCPRSPFTGSEAHEVRVWGRRRLYVLERLLPVARSFSVTLLGTGLPSFWVADLGDMSFTLGLSGWTANNWSESGNLDLMAPRATVDSATQQRVFDALRAKWLATPEELAAELSLERKTVLGALAAWTQAGRAIYDLNKHVYRARELSLDPLPIDALRFTNERESKAWELVQNHAITQLDTRALENGGVGLSGKVGRHAPSLVLDGDERMRHAECDCHYYVHHKLNRGPCEHILALRAAHRRWLGEEAPC